MPSARRAPLCARFPRIIDGLLRDVRFAGRLLRQTPVVSAVALLSLALGIGANVAIFSLVNALLVKALPVHEPDRLVQWQFGSSTRPTTFLTNPQWEYIRDHQDVLSGVFATSSTRFNLNAGGELRPAAGIWASARYFDVLGVVPIIGRGFTGDDDRRGGGEHGPVSVISYGFWQREFGGDPAAVGRTLTLDGHAFTIVGVTPADFFGTTVGRSFDVIVPIGAEPVIRGVESGLDRRSMWWLTIIGRLSPGQTREAAEAALGALQPSLRAATMPQDWRPKDQEQYLAEPIQLTAAATGISALRDRYSRPLFVLLGIVGLVLLIACANMANLLLAQSAARRRELAVRLSLGASRMRLVRQLLVESVLLSNAGALAGMAVAVWGSRAVVSLLSTSTQLVALDLSFDWRVFAFASAVGVLTGLLFGVAPAVQSTRVAPADALRDHGRGVIFGGVRPGMGHLLVAAQVALSFVLVFGAGLFVRTLVSITTQNLGFDASRVIVANLDLRRTGTAAAARFGLFDRVREQVATTPGVDAAALSFVTPMSNATWNLRITVPGYDAPERDRVVLYNGVSQAYFRSLGTPLLAGRDFADRDTAAAPGVAIVNEAFARKYFSGQNPVGRTFTIEGFSSRPERPLEVVGLVADSAYRSLRDPLPPTMYAPMAQEPEVSSAVRMVIRTRADPSTARTSVLAAVAAVDDDIVVDLRPMAEDLNAAVLQERLVASLSAFFGALALLLAGLGLYGVMSYTVARRTNEIGIRIALGAEPRRVVRLILRHVAAITLAGLAAGVVAAAATGRFINALLFNLAATDGTMLALTAVALGGAAALAGFLPARRAARIDPMTALRED
jgi:predicted permease